MALKKTIKSVGDLRDYVRYYYRNGHSDKAKKVYEIYKDYGGVNSYERIVADLKLPKTKKPVKTDFDVKGHKVFSTEYSKHLK